jgi:SulP family sulfate permease
MQIVHGLRFDNIRGDIFGGLTAAVVALPLALAFGVASGAGPIAGIYGAIAVGFFAALFGGTPSQVSGPTGPMTVVMAAIVIQYQHDPAMAFTVVMLGGFFQILFGLFRIGHFIDMMPFPVISGFMSGIGCIIIILQVAPLFGHDIPSGGTLGALTALPDILSKPNWDALSVGIFCFGIAMFMPARIGRILPSPLIALFVGTACVFFLLPTAPVLGEVPTGLPKFRLPGFTLHALPHMVGSALVLAALGSLDSLLTSLIADNVTRTHHKSERELIGQGIGNMVAGLIGGLPGAGATMRTVINVRAGGRTPISGALHALVLLAIVLGMAPLAAHIPNAVLAGILFKVGVDIIDWDYLKRIRRAPKQGVFFMIVVLGLTVFVDLIVAVAAGVVMASLLFVKRMADIQQAGMQSATASHPELVLTAEESAILDKADGRLLLFSFDGPVSFGVAKRLSRQLGMADDYAVLILDLSAVPLIDSSASLALEDAVLDAIRHNRIVFIAGLAPRVRNTLERIGTLAKLPRNCCQESRQSAFRAAAAVVKADL